VNAQSSRGIILLEFKVNLCRRNHQFVVRFELSILLVQRSFLTWINPFLNRLIVHRSGIDGETVTVYEKVLKLVYFNIEVVVMVVMVLVHFLDHSIFIHPHSFLLLHL
jgi:hypothetical protein